MTEKVSSVKIIKIISFYLQIKYVEFSHKLTSKAFIKLKDFKKKNLTLKLRKINDRFLYSHHVSKIIGKNNAVENTIKDNKISDDESVKIWSRFQF